MVPATWPEKQEHLTVWERSSMWFRLQQRWVAITSQVPCFTGTAGASTDPDRVASPGQRPSSPFPQLHALSPSSSQLGAGVGKRFPIAGEEEVDEISLPHPRAPVLPSSPARLHSSPWQSLALAQEKDGVHTSPHLLASSSGIVLSLMDGHPGSLLTVPRAPDLGPSTQQVLKASFL